MKKILLLAVALTTAFFIYRHSSRSVPVAVYETFPEAWVRGYQEDALHLADGEAARKDVNRYPRVGLVPASLIELIHGIGQKVESFGKVEGGDVAIEAKQTLAFDPPGITSAIGGAMVMTFHHTVQMRKTAEGWKIVAFKPTFLEVRDVRRR